MRKFLSILILLSLSSVSSGQGLDTGKYDMGKYGSLRPLGDMRASKHDTGSLSNPYGAGSRYKPDGLLNPYSRNASPYSDQSWRNPYASSPPRIYSSEGYHGELSTSRYRSDSISNPYGRYGSRYSSDSINNPYGAGNPYSTAPLYVLPSRN